MSSLIEVEIAYARPDKQIILTILAPVGSTIEQVLLSSSIRDHFPEISLDDIKVGIFSKASKLSTIVEEFDRIEIYRPLIGDPKEIRKIRAARIAKKMDKSNNFSEIITNEEQAWLALNLNQKINLIERLKQGNTNTVFLLYCANDQKFIFKRLNRTLLTEVDRFNEIQVHKLASEYLLSSNIIASDEKFLLQEFIEGKALTKSWPIKTLAKQLYLIHKLPAKFASKQSLALDLQFLYKKHISKNIKINKERFDEMFELAVTLDKKSPLNTLCHGDLSFSNLVSTQLIPDQDAKIMILDWEYSRLASAAYDLAATISINKFNIEEGDQLIAYYCSFQKGNSGLLDEIKLEINGYLSLFYYLNKLWRFEVDIS